MSHCRYDLVSSFHNACPACWSALMCTVIAPHDHCHDSICSSMFQDDGQKITSHIKSLPLPVVSVRCCGLCGTKVSNTISISHFFCHIDLGMWTPEVWKSTIFMYNNTHWWLYKSGHVEGQTAWTWQHQ